MSSTLIIRKTYFATRGLFQNWVSGWETSVPPPSKSRGGVFYIWEGAYTTPTLLRPYLAQHYGFTTVLKGGGGYFRICIFFGEEKKH